MALANVRRCVHCGSEAKLTFRNITKRLEDGTMLRVEGIPVYHCEFCRQETMSLRTRARVEKLVQQYIDQRSACLGPFIRYGIPLEALADGS